jgi:hypothetical protein
MGDVRAWKPKANRINKNRDLFKKCSGDLEAVKIPVGR